MTGPLCRGAAFSGGGPFSRAEGLCEQAALLKGRGRGIASYSGCAFEELLKGDPAQRRLPGLPDVLVGGPFLLEEMSHDPGFRGSRDRMVLNVGESLRCAEAAEGTGERRLGGY